MNCRERAGALPRPCDDRRGMADEPLLAAMNGGAAES
jgi:hypothetical protein